MDQEVRLNIHDKVDQTFWSTVISHIIHAISGPLFSYKHISETKEVNVRAYLTEPVIRELTQHLSNLEVEGPEGCSLFTACLNMEQKYSFAYWESLVNQTCLSIVLKNRYKAVLNLFNIIPGEAKVDVKKNEDYYKLSVYMGLLMDHTKFRIAFCPLGYDDGSIILVTFMTPHNMESSGHIPS